MTTTQSTELATITSENPTDEQQEEADMSPSVPKDAELHHVTDYTTSTKVTRTSRFTGKPWDETVQVFLCPRCDEKMRRPAHAQTTGHTCGLWMVAYGNALYLWDREENKHEPK